MDFPLTLRFKRIALSPQISVTDPAGRLHLYVRQQAFKLKEAITVFADAEQTRPLYRIAADRVLDISARYLIEDAAGAQLGFLQRRGMRSLWRAHYEVHRGEGPVLVIREENPWAKVADQFLGEIPVLGLLTGYLFHPAYRVLRADGSVVLRLVKQPAILEGLYTIERTEELKPADEILAVLSVVMLVLLERRRG